MDHVQDADALSSENKKSWSTRNIEMDEDWVNVMENLVAKFCINRGFRTCECTSCKIQLDSHAIRCQTCNLIYYGDCDHLVHSKQPLHDRWKTEKGHWINFLPNKFVTFPRGDAFKEGSKLW